MDREILPKMAGFNWNGLESFAWNDPRGAVPGETWEVLNIWEK